MMDRREELREENHARDQAGLPSGVLKARTDLIPAPEGDSPAHQYLYPVRGEHESLDERMLADLLERVQKLQQEVAAQEVVLKALVVWRMAHARLPHAPGSTQGPVRGEGQPQGGQGEPKEWQPFDT